MISQEPERSPKTIIQGDKVTFTCSVKRSNPQPDSFTWLKDGNPFKSKNITVVENIQPEDSGDYTCRAENKVGSGSKTLQLTVECKFYTSVFHMSINIAEKIKKNRLVLMLDKLFQYQKYSENYLLFSRQTKENQHFYLSNKSEN